LESLANTEFLAEVEPELSNLSDNAAQNSKTQEQQRWRAKKAEQTSISKGNPLIHMAELVFKDAKIPHQW
jgi:hypothetical protein